MSSSTRKYQHLTDEQTAHFMKYGYLRLTNCFTPSQAAQWTSAVWTRLGFSPTDKSTWTRERTNMPAHNTVAVSSFAPKAWAAICELCGGEDRIHPASRTWNDALIVNLGSPENEGKELDPKKLSGWHVDGDFFVHFLDSPEQGLLVIPVFTEIVPNGGGTVVAPEGVGRIARHLYEHPEGVSPRMVSIDEPTAFNEGLGFYNNLIQSLSDFHEMTGDIGDVILLHPLMVHSASKNGLRNPRIITNPPVSLKQPFNFDRANPEEYSLVELKTMRELGVDGEKGEGLRGWEIKGKRERVVPERERVQEKMKREEEARLKAQREQGGLTVERPKEMSVGA